MGNLFVDGARAGFFDWANAHAQGRDVGRRVRDLQLGADRDPPGQRTGLDRAATASSSRETAIELDADAAWEQYRLYAVYSWNSAVSTAAMGSRWQPEARAHAAMLRTTTAIEDLDSLGLLEEKLRRMKLDAMSGGLPIRRIHELAGEVEDAGFSGLWITEGGRSAYNLCTAAALATDTLELGTAIAVAFPRSPMVTAQIAWELQEATGGRFVLGLGTQVKAHIERRYATAFEHPGPRIREYVLAVKAMLPRLPGHRAAQVRGRLLLAVAPPRHVVAGRRSTRPIRRSTSPR